MAYEVIIATGRADGADADKPLKLALVYNDANGNEQIGDLIQLPSASATHSNIFENGQLDLFNAIDFTRGGVSINTDDFTGVMVGFTDKDWQLDTIWITNRQTGMYCWKHADKFFGSGPGVGTASNPYRLLLDGDRAVEPGLVDPPRIVDSFNMRISTQGGNSDYGTNGHVYFKLFDNTGHASHASRKDQWFNQYQAGETNDLPGFDTQFGPLSHEIINVLIFKDDGDGWRPDTLQIKASILAQGVDYFDLASHMPPGEVSLDTHHNWMMAPRSSREPVKEGA
jgi:hypothetical protein